MLCREELLDRLIRAQARLIVLAAPAGFGKSAVAQAYVQRRGGGLVVDGEGVGSELDLARRIVEALGDGRDALARLQDGGATIAERLDDVLAAWRKSTHACTVFDHCERIVAVPSAREFFGRIVAARPAPHTALLCSRGPLRGVPFNRFALPHERVTLHAADLAFDAAGVRQLFAGLVEDDAVLEQIQALSQGWPVAVFLLRRFAEDGRLAAALHAPGGAQLRELHEYLASEVIAGFDQPLLDALSRCAALGEALPGDLGDVEAQALVATGFVTLREDGTLLVHPLLRGALVRQNEAQQEEAVRTIAREHEEHGDALRAAELYVRTGDRYAAARALGSHEVIADRAPSARYRAVLAQLDAGSIARFPRLWGVSTLTRMFCTDSSSLLDEAETVWRTLPPQTPALERYYVLVFRILLMSYLGSYDDALAALEAFAHASGAADPPQSPLDAHRLYLRGLLRARSGSFDRGERDLNVALPLVERMDVIASGVYLALGADIARVRGEWSVERQFVTRARERAGASGLQNFVAFDLAEALVGAWFAGDRVAFNDIAVDLERAVEQGGVAGFAYLAHVARGRTVVPQPADLPKFLIFGQLIALSRSRDEAQRAELANDALARAQRLRMPFVEALAAVAVALCEPARFEAATAIARQAAARCDAPAFVHAVAAFSAQHDNVGMLAPFVTQITRDRSEAAPVALDVLGGRVRVDGKLARVSGRELELLAALAQRREPTARAKLAAMMWPDLDEFAARNALSVCLHRVRSHIGRDDAIEREAGGYRLHADAFVDLWEIERAAIVLRSRERLREGDRASIVRALDRLRAERAAVLESWEWFAPVLRRLDDARTEMAHRLAVDALERGDPEAALAFAADIIALDPCDEPAREIAIRAHLALGDRAAALRQYRQYRDVLRAEFAAEPSAALTQLVMGA